MLDQIKKVNIMLIYYTVMPSVTVYLGDVTPLGDVKPKSSSFSTSVELFIVFIPRGTQA